TFSVAAPTQVLFDSQTNDGQLQWSLVGPPGTEQSALAFVSTPSVLTLVPGSYTLTVDGVGDETTAYSFRLLDLAAAPTLTPGTPVTGALNPGNATDLYRFTATAGQQLYFDNRNLVGSANWRLVDPFGDNVFGPQFGGTDVERPIIRVTGTYVLAIEGNSSNPSAVNYTFNVQPITDTSHALTIGATTSGTIAQTGQRDLYTFSVATPTLVLFDGQTNDGQLQWSLVGPPGTEQSALAFTSAPSVLNLIPGSYTLTIDGAGDETSAYSSRLLHLAPAPTLPPGTPVTGALNPGNATDLYRFAATAGQPLYFDNRNLVGSANWRLVDPFGDNVFGPQFGGTDIERPIIRV